MTPAPALTHELVTDDDRLKELGPEWNALAAAAGPDAFFGRHVFAMENWKLTSAIASSRLHTITIRRGERLVAVAPMTMEPHPFGRSVLRWLDSRTPLYTALPCLPDEETDVFRYLIGVIRRMPGVRLLKAGYVPDDSCLARFMLAAQARSHDGGHAYHIRLDGGSPRTALSRGRRRDLARYERRLSDLGKIERGTVTEPAAVGETVSWILARKHEQFGTGSWISRGETQAYFNIVARELAKHGQAFCSVLLLDGKTIAASFFFRDGQMAYWSKTAYDPAFARYSPGWLDFTAAIDALAASGATLLDAMTGQDFMKSQFSNDQRGVRGWRLRLRWWRL